MSFPRTQQANLSAFSSHYPLAYAERQAGSCKFQFFEVLGMTRPGFKPRIYPLLTWALEPLLHLTNVKTTIEMATTFSYKRSNAQLPVILLYSTYVILMCEVTEWIKR